MKSLHALALGLVWLSSNVSLGAVGNADLMPAAAGAGQTPTTAGTAGATGTTGTPRPEEFRYRWHLSNFVGRVAGLFFPDTGDGALTFVEQPNGLLKSELTITSPQTHDGEYFRYGSEVDAQTLRPVRAWSSYKWRGESKSKSDEIRQAGVLDIAAGIYSIRRDPPKTSRRIHIWSDGKVYPVVILPRGVEARTISGKKISARHFSIRAVEVPGERKWKGKIDLWFSNGADATPVEIMISRNLADVRLELVPAQGPRR